MEQEADSEMKQWKYITGYSKSGQTHKECLWEATEECRTYHTMDQPGGNVNGWWRWSLKTIYIITTISLWLLLHGYLNTILDLSFVNHPVLFWWQCSFTCLFTSPSVHTFKPGIHEHDLLYSYLLLVHIYFNLGKNKQSWITQNDKTVWHSERVKRILHCPKTFWCCVLSIFTSF